jgi:hypothetical protein
MAIVDDQTKQHLERIEHAISEVRDRVRTIDARLDALGVRLLAMDRRLERVASETETRDARSLSVLRFEAENIRHLVRQATHATTIVAAERPAAPPASESRRRRAKTAVRGAAARRSSRSRAQARSRR